MSEVNPVTTAQVACTSETADAMLKRVFKVAKILATVKHSQNVPTETAENRAENRHLGELQYREEDLTTHTA
jgi:hypothetical protein